jgi:hypothetical protein
MVWKVADFLIRRRRTHRSWNTVECRGDESRKDAGDTYGPIRNRARKNSHPQSEPTGYDLIRLDRIQIIHTFVQPPPGVRNGPTGCVSLTNSHSLWNISSVKNTIQTLKQALRPLFAWSRRRARGESAGTSFVECRDCRLE